MSRYLSTLGPLAFGLACALAAGAALADRALVIGASEESRRGLWWSGGGEADSAQALREAGFDVITADAGSVGDMRKALSAFLNGIEEEARVVVHLSGAFLNGAGRTWLVEAERTGRPDLATIDDIALSVDTVLAVAGRVPGAAIVALGTVEGEVTPGAGLEAGPSALVPPQGVTLVTGADEAVAEFVTDPLLVEGQSLPEAIAAVRGLRGSGFLSGRVAFIPAGTERPVAPPNAAEVERAIWQASLAQDSVEGYRGYLQRYPDGFFAAEARAAIERIETEPGREARLAEEALALDRADRRTIQQQLTLLGFEPRGVDGVFGSGSRAAISRFQAKNGFPETGFLNATQIERLALQAERREAEVAAETRRQELEREKRDREAWAAVSETGDEAGLRTYLERYPNGLFAPIAKERLAAIDATAKAQAEALERADWERAAAAGTEEALAAYLAAHPNGANAAVARERLEAMANAGSEAMQAAEAAEAALGLNPVTRTLVERRLEQLNLDPGPVDGSFDDQTRAAIRRYQRARGLDVTGYMNEVVVAQMLADLGGLLMPER
ncbi:peptidoglycan-binding domain-containing protein [Tropicimonas sp. IMCC6043]|uniref:peptidoglycan-binding domain-containing protein n=1 Tax=Tropicimonas sp. IMCC6043 TaxID=2510645 RepID=UPI00101D6E95|nr:peptidoglycan-binding domain-containing protein [Tropicimonas sp. IMCC6043]RYH08241.1 peptidoglycan-binding protein [Tropicimonas sp. IMCC6043]